MNNRTSYLKLRIAILVAGISLPLITVFQNCGAGFQNTLNEAVDLSSSAPDTTPPQISVLTATTGIVFKAQSPINGTCEADINLQYAFDNIQNMQSVLCSQSSFSIAIPSTLTDGQHTLFF